MAGPTLHEEIPMSTSLTWYGHSNFLLSADGVSVLIDPFFTHNPTCPAGWDAVHPDLVLVTHDHGDHVGDAVAICKNTGAVCGCVVGTAEKLIQAGIPSEQIPGGIGFNIGGTITVKNVRVTMTQAFHSSDSGVPTGFVITMPNGFTCYHAGDTGIFSSMGMLGLLYPLDLALLPIGGFFTMDAEQAAHATRLLNPAAVVPMHWGPFPMLAQTPDEFADKLSEQAPRTRLTVMRPGMTLEF